MRREKKKYIRVILFIIFCLGLLHLGIAQEDNSINLSGEWSVSLEHYSGDEGSLEDIKNKQGRINLPGTLAEHGFGIETTGASKGVLTPTHKFIGTASYKKSIHIPKEWKNKKILLFLERVLWQSQVYIDGTPVSTQNALGTPHIHDLGKLPIGPHELEVRVNNDMIFNIGDKGHAYSESTQSIWNGLVGTIKLQSKDPSHIKNLTGIPNIDDDQLKIALDIEAELSEKTKIQIAIEAIESNQPMLKKVVRVPLSQGKNHHEIILDLKGKLKKWSEFDPNVYRLKASLSSKSSFDIKETEFGFREVGHDGTHVLINGNPIFLRGNLDNVHFPLTGYPSTTLEDWENIFKIYKDYGLNHVRFHSWCPPEAAFKAADRTGIYIQAEASVWIDSWMNEDMVAKGRPEMETKGHPKGLGYNSERDQWVQAEMNRVVEYYGNHPSFIMFCIGNELGSSDFDQIKTWIGDLKKKDDRRLYSGSTARQITDEDDFVVTHLVQNVGWTRGLNGAHTDWDFEKVYSQMDIPTLAHEIGQWPVYPKWSEIDKYTGVLKARNLEEFKVVAQKNGIADQDGAFHKASGALNQIMYKYEIESFLRTKSCAGIQLLSMQDYQGQGEALVGWLDVFWANKGITTPKEFKEHHSETVPLLRMEKFVWESGELFQANVQLSHYGSQLIKDAVAVGRITTNEGKVLLQKEWPLKEVAIGDLQDVGAMELELGSIQKAQELNIEVAIKNTPYINHWSIWVFPSKLPPLNNEGVVIVDEMNTKTLELLNKGAKVLLMAHNLGTKKNSVPFNFYPLYWSYTYFPGQGKTSLGMLIDDEHPALSQFPTSFHSDWQWEPFDKKAKGFVLNSMPPAYKPIVQLVDDFHRNNKEGLIFEFKVGQGKLLVSGFDLNEENVVAKQLKHSLLSYMSSESFNPQEAVSPAFLIENFSNAPEEDQETNTLLKVKAANLVKPNSEQNIWSPEVDKIEIKAKNTDYSVRLDRLVANQGVSVWQGNKIEVNIDCPDGFLGSLYVLLENMEDEAGPVALEFEGRKNSISPKPGESKWVKFHVMREDSNDGKLKLKGFAKKNRNISISQLILNQE